MFSPRPLIPDSVCIVVGKVIGDHYFNHNTINALFAEAGAPGQPPEGNCVNKSTAWLVRVNKEHPTPLDVLGQLVKHFMDLDPGFEKTANDQQRIQNALSRHRLRYERGGYILPSLGTQATKDLATKLQERDLPGVQVEFERALAFVRTDPGAAVTAACSMLEAAFKNCLEAEGQPMPSVQSVSPLWTAVRKHMRLAPEDLKDDDTRRIIGGLSSAVDGIGALRTHAGSAHGGGMHRSQPTESEARLAIHAAQAIVLFLLER